ncbi:septation protein SepH [Ornithinimicrobium cerasi]|uniref:septation protein SepH n=1 Tax=Ornithinimicrobium cerasi TaxID=2248773 RepID=UPI000F0088C4|nr:septation protein SepH [Ornithinimicrobium cerasi]
MQQLQFTELDDGGRLVVVADDGTRYAVPVDDRLRAALRARPHAPTPQRTGSAATPREVQSMIRAGQTAEEVASATGWDLARVQRFEGPVLAEREHVVGLARAAAVRAQGRTDGSHTLERRVRERLQTRGVRSEEIAWDAARTEAQGPWTVLVVFSAGGRERRAAWHYAVPDRSLEALDDEARWLSEDEQALPGGLAGHPLLGTAAGTDEANDLMATMRARRQRRTATRRPRRTEGTERQDDAQDPSAGAPGAGGELVDEVLPIEDFDFDHAQQGDPPAAHSRGSAAESPSPVVAPGGEGLHDGGPHDGGPHDGNGHDGAGHGEPGHGDDATPEDPSARRRRERRRLRIPKLPAAVGGPDGSDGESEPEGTYARTADPLEVSFDEFFGTDEEDVDETGLDAEDDVDEEELDAEDLDGADAPDDDVDSLAGGRPDEEPGAQGDVSTGQHGGHEADGDAGAPAAAGGSQATADAAPEDETDAGARRKGRTSVPSWDDIMFGSGNRRR